MAQLPPKIPNWPDFKDKTSQNSSWVDEFLDFSSSRRGTHRRSVSDSIAFLEPPILHEECRPSGNDFDKFDDEQLMSMFTDDTPNAVSSSNPSSPSDHNSINDAKDPPSDPHNNHNHHQHQSDDAQSQCLTETQPHQSNNSDNNTTTDRIVDPKRVKR